MRKLPEHVFTRLIDAPRRLVWEAWTKREHLMAWFAPDGFTVADADIDPRPGGAMHIVMRSPDGHDYPSTGFVRAIKPPERLVFVTALNGADGKAMLEDESTLTLVEVKGKTKLTLRARITKMTDEAKPALDGMEEGWNQTLDRLGRLVETLKPKRSTRHHTFTIERTFAASRDVVFKAFADQKVKAHWFVGPEEWDRSDHTMDFRVGGRESVSGGPPGGPVHSFSGIYQDIVPNERIIYTYDMHLDDQRISVSLATIELAPSGQGAKLKLTEQGAFLEGYDDPAERERGTHGILDQLDAELKRLAARR